MEVGTRSEPYSAGEKGPELLLKFRGGGVSQAKSYLNLDPNSMTMPGITVQIVSSNQPDLGATLDNINLESLSDAEFTTLRNALYTHVICICQTYQTDNPASLLCT